MQKIRTRILWQASSGGGLNVPSQLKLALLLLFVAALYFPSLENGYVGWDDALIYSNREIRSLSPGNLARMFLPSAGGTASYQPLRTLSYAVVYAANGARPFGYLLFNILLYLANILLFYIVVEYLLAQHGGHRLRRSSANLAFVAAAAFALMPVHVEVVSWLQGGKQTLMGAFFLGSFFFYLRFRAGCGERFYWLSVLLFLCALTAQPGAIALPLLLAGYDVLVADKRGEARGERFFRMGIRLLPFFLPALALGLQLTLISTVRIDSPEEPAIVARVFTVPILWGKYLLKLLVPVNLCCRYPMMVPDAAPLAAGAAAALVLAGAGWAFLRLVRAKVLALLGLVWFTATLLPTSGLVTTSTLMADRYLYLPGMGFGLLVALFYNELRDRYLNSPHKLYPLVVRILMVVIVASWAVLSLQREFDWRDGIHLWSRVVKIYPRHDLATFNLAEAYQKRGMLQQAMEGYQKVLEINPAYGDAYVNLGVVLRKVGQEQKALANFTRAVKLRPDRAEAWINLGITEANLGEDSVAFAAFEKAIRLGGKARWKAYYNRAKLLLAWGFEDRAVADLETAARLSPHRVSGEVWCDLGRTLQRLGRLELALELVSLGKEEPAFDAACWRMLGNLQVLTSRNAEAIESLRKAIRLDPEDYRSFVLLGVAYHQAGFAHEAVKAYRRALELGGPDREKLLSNLGLALADAGLPDQAERAYRKALRLNPCYIEAWVNLAGLYRQQGKLAQARRSIETALVLCSDIPEAAQYMETLKQLLDQMQPERN